MDVAVASLAPALETFIAEATDAAGVRVRGLALLPGGAVHENWGFEAAIEGGTLSGHHALVLRRDSPIRLAATIGRRTEFDILKVAWEADVTAPEPLWTGTGRGVADGAFFIMRRILGSALPRDIVGGGDPDGLAARLGAELARIHAIRPTPPRLSVLGPPGVPVTAGIAAYQRHRKHHCPALGDAERWLERHAPDCRQVTLVHRDFRVGNLMVDRGDLSGVLDWAFAGWGDPMEDIGWFCAKCWRYGPDYLEAGGIASRASFYRGYEAAADRTIDDVAVVFWEIFAHYRWAVIAHMQAERLRLGAGPIEELETAPGRAAAATSEMYKLISVLVD